METKASITIGAVACIGIALLLVGADVIPQRVFKPNFPSWMLIVLGLCLIAACVSVALGIGSPIGTRLIGVTLLLMALAFFWVALFADPRHMNGGIPFLPDQFNWFLGRAMFGLCALFFLWLGVSVFQ